MNEIYMDVIGVKCASCAKKMEGALRRVPGVTEVEVDLNEARVVVVGDGTVTEDALRRKVFEAGYKVR